MKNARTIMTLGILVAVMPALGFPGGWKSVFYFIFGAAIAILAFLGARSGKTRVSGTSEFREHKSYEQNELQDVSKEEHE